MEKKHKPKPHMHFDGSVPKDTLEPFPILAKWRPRKIDNWKALVSIVATVPGAIVPPRPPTGRKTQGYLRQGEANKQWYLDMDCFSDKHCPFTYRKIVSEEYILKFRQDFEFITHEND